MIEYKKIVFVMLIAFLYLASCQEAGSPAESNVEQILPAAESTALPKATTQIPIIAPPTATPAYTGPIISLLAGQTISDGGQFSPLALDEYVSDPDHSEDEITWSHSGEKELAVRITRRVLIVSRPAPEWIGSETISLEACDPENQCATADVVYTVEWVNDPPVIAKFDDQLIFPGEFFTEIALDAYVDDADNTNDEMVWTYSGSTALEVQIDADRMATVTLPGPDWRGPEVIQFTGCEPEGQCGSSAAIFQVQDSADLKITFIANAGFVIEAEEKKIAIDAILLPWDGYHSFTNADLLKIENSRPPFDDIDLVIVTHNHFDHFNAGVVSTFLENNPTSTLITNRDVADNLPKQERVIGLRIKDSESSKLIVDGIGIELMNFPHGSGAPHNLGVVISVGGFRILHTGDLDPESTEEVLSKYKLSERGIDVALVPAFWLTISKYHHFVTEMSVPYIIPMHFDPATSSMINAMRTDFPAAIFFQQIYATWELAHE